MGTASEPAYITDTYDPQTSRLTEQNTQTGTVPTSIDDLHYTYDQVGNITSEADTPAGAGSATDVQCFQYDYLARLTQAWAQGNTGCASTPSASAEGGAAPYWSAYAYNALGNLTGVTSTAPTGAVTTTADSYPAIGAARPHAVSTQSITTASGNTTNNYGYDAAGQLTTVSGTAGSQTLTWDDSGQLSLDTVTPAGGSAQNTSYVYDADGTLLLAATPATTTLYLPDEELSLNAGNGAVTGTRYYSLNGLAVAARTNALAVAYLAGDQQGTDSVAIDASSLAVTRRYYDPYGNLRGTTPAAFPTGQKGFIGGTADPSTGLTNLGAREYQPATGSFISPDPLLNPYDPQHLNAYAYAQGNPTTYSDPTGATRCDVGDCPTQWQNTHGPNAPPAPPPPAPSTVHSHNRTTPHNQARDAAIQVIKAQLAALGVTDYKIYTNLKVPGAAKRCKAAMKKDPTLTMADCQGVGIPDIVVYDEKSHVYFVWEVKSVSEAGKAVEEAQWYVDGIRDIGGTAYLGWIIGGPYPVAASRDKIIGPAQGAIIYGKVKDRRWQRVNARVQPTPEPNVQPIMPGLDYVQDMGYVPHAQNINWLQVAIAIFGVPLVLAAVTFALIPGGAEIEAVEGSTVVQYVLAA